MNMFLLPLHFFYMDKIIFETLTFVQNVTDGWESMTSAQQAYDLKLTDALRDQKSGCTMKARFARQLLEMLGYDVQLIHGYYFAPQREWKLHSWISVNGAEYDPSRNDFQITSNHSLICPDPKIRRWEQIIKVKK